MKTQHFQTEWSTIQQKLGWFSIMLLFIVPFSFGQNEETIEFINGLGIDVGRGFDLLKGQASARIPLVNRTHGLLPGGQRTTFELKQISNSVDLEEALGVEVDVSGSFLFWSASAKTLFLKEKKINKYNLYYMIKSSVLNQEDILSTDPALTEDAKKLLNDPKNLNQFTLAYGSHFVYGLVTGGEYFGILEIECFSESDKLLVDQSIKAGGLFWDARATFSYKVKEVAKTHKLSLKEIIIGGVGVKPSTSVDEMITLAQSFPAKVLANPVQTHAILMPYTVFPEYSAIFNDLDLDRRYALLETTINYLDYLYLKNHIDYIVSNHGLFRFNPATKNNDITTLIQQSKTIQFKLEELKARRDQLIERAKPIPALTQTAQAFGSTVSLPRLYKGYAPNLNPVLNIPANSLFPLNKRIKGDDEMAGHRPRVTVTSELLPRNMGKEIVLNISCTMSENQSDWTTFTDNKEFIWKLVSRDFPEGIRVKSVYPTGGNLVAQGGEDDHSWHIYNGTGLIKSANCISDTDGGETGDIGCKDITFNSVTVMYVHEEDYLNLPYVYDKASEVPAKIFYHVLPPKTTLMIKPMVKMEDLKNRILIKRINN